MQTYTGTTGNDVFVAPTTEDWTFIGKAGRDTLTGNIGNDIFLGGFGNDVLDGEGGDDIFNVGVMEGVDSITGGDGFDRIVAQANNVAIGLSFIAGIEEISSGGFSPVGIIGSSLGDILDFTGVTLIGITSINSGAGADTVTGTAGDDTINGGGGNDILNGAAGNDIFNVGANAGFDRYEGGSGSNTIQAIANGALIGIASLANIQEISSGGFLNVRIQTATGPGIYDFSAVALSEIVSINGGDGGQTIIGGEADDFINGGTGNDTLIGGEGSDFLNGGGGANILNGGNGDDFFTVAGGLANRYFGGAGYDTILAGKENAVITLTTGSLSGIEEINSNGFGNISIQGTIGADVFSFASVLLTEGDIVSINGGAGADRITGSKVGDTINGGNDDDRIFGLTGDDIIDGGQGDDYLDGGFGFDFINGGNGNDTIVAGPGQDVLAGDAGDDIFLVIGASGLDLYDGGSGFDTIQGGSNGAKISIGGLTSVERISSGGFNNVIILGTADADVLDFTFVELVGIRSINASLSGDTITGSAGSDTILGQGAEDILNGGGGNDIITGGGGLDTLTGGAGADIFRDGTKGLTGDTITDFGTGDRLQFVNIANPAAVTFAFADNILTVDPDGPNGQRAFSLTVTGSFDAAFFVASSDGAGGTFVDYIVPSASLVLVGENYYSAIG